MKNSSVIATIVSVVILLSGMGFAPLSALGEPAVEEAQPPREIQIIKIRDVGYEGALRVEPSKVTVPKGMVIVWVNMSRKAEPQIVFAEGMKCELSTEASADFKQDERKCFITDFVQVGGSSSLKFIGDGVFDYEVVNKKGQKGKGTIVVE